MYADFNVFPLIKVIREESLEKIAEFLEQNFKEYATAENGKETKQIEILDKNTLATPLFYVTARATDDECVEVAKLLVDKYNLCKAETKDLMKQTCLFYAAREGHINLCKYLIEKGCKPNDADNFGQHCLFYASREGKTECVQYLINTGANPNLLDYNKQTCLFYASRDGRYDTVKCLLENGVNPNVKDVQRRTAMTFAKGNGHMNVIHLLKTLSTSNRGSADLLQQPGNQGLLNRGSSSNITGTYDLGMRKKYKLQYRPLDDDPILWLDAPLVKINEFERRFPQLAVWPKDDSAPVNTEVNNMNNMFIKQWYASANHLIQCLSKYEGGHIFEKLVDPKKQNCPDYYDVIKNPMSFSCIKAKLKKGQYKSPTEFISDVQLIFSNCNLYNSSNSLVAITGKNIETYFNNQMIVTGFIHFVTKEKRINELLKKAEEENNIDKFHC